MTVQIIQCLFGTGHLDEGLECLGAENLDEGLQSLAAGCAAKLAVFAARGWERRGNQG